MLTSLIAATLIAQPKTFAKTVAYHEKMQGNALLVMQNGKIIFEKYAESRGSQRASELASGTKSFAGVVAIAAEEDGLLKLTDKVSDTITEWKSDKRKSQITIWQLLHLVSGLKGGPNLQPPTYADAIKEETFTDPNTRFQYGPSPFQVFGELMKRKLKPKGEDYIGYLERRVLNPIGCKIGFWRKKAGDPTIPSGCYMNAREWVKFGEFVRNYGKWEGKQLIAKSQILKLSEPSIPNKEYGLTFWTSGDLATDPNYSKEPTMFMAAGMGNQRCYIIRSANLVVVRQAPVTSTRQYDDAEFLQAVSADLGLQIKVNSPKRPGGG